MLNATQQYFPYDYYMVASIPKHPQYIGDIVRVRVTTNINSTTSNHSDFLLNRWKLHYTYDHNLFGFVNYTLSDYYLGNGSDMHVTSVNHSNGSIFVTSGVHGENAPVNTTLSFSKTFLVELCFRVMYDATPGVHSDTMGLSTSYMLDIDNVDLQTQGGYNNTAVLPDHQITGLFDDEVAGYNHTMGTITLVKVEYAGVLAYTNQNELVNTAVLTGLPVRSDVIVYGVNDHYVSSGSGCLSDEVDDMSNLRSCCSDGYNPSDTNTFIDITPYVSCSISSWSNTSAFADGNPVADVSEGCVVTADKHHTEGHNALTVLVEFQNVETTVPFRVWFAQKAKVIVNDKLLNKIV